MNAREQIVGITRVRNEALIIEDTLRHFRNYCSAIIVYDDASTDDTPKIAASVPDVTVIRSTEWRLDRPAEETRHRDLLLRTARSIGAEWVLCFDADERLVGDLPDLSADGYRFRLFDGYMTRTHDAPYRGGPLADLSRMWGPEYRDILFLYRTDPHLFRFRGLDQRAPVPSGRVELADVKVKHFGKCISVEQWEQTCDYYIAHFPKRYRTKWKARKGRAIHTLSDFNRTLYTWRQLMERPQDWHKIG